MDKLITSAANPEIKMLRSLAQKKYREEENLFLLEGMPHVKEALAGGLELAKLIYTAEARNYIQQIETKAERIEVSAEIMSRITGRDNAQPVLGAFRPRWIDIAMVRDSLWVGLETIRDPGNLGTIIRTADAAGAKGVLLIGECCDPWAPETVRASMGSISRIVIARAGAPEFVAWKRRGWSGQVIGTHLRTETDYRNADYALPLMLLMGGESNGLSDEVAGACDRLVRIPMAGGVSSLNVATVGALLAFEVVRQRGDAARGR